MPQRPVALVTGASSGIGLSFAEQLAKGGHDLVVVARRKERLDALAKRVERDFGAKTEILVLDLATPAGTAAAEARAARGDLALLVNNAGVSRYAPFAGLDPNAIDELVRIHILGTTHLARAALPGMIERGNGGIINVASLLALSGTVPPVPMPYRAVYAGAKAYLLAFSQTLSHEVGGKGVRVQALLPGIVETEFHDDMGPAKAHLPPGMKADDVVRASLAALAKGEVVCIPPLEEAGAFEKIGEAQRATLASARNTALAPRYR
jgi:short-subunit dehydrogenase